MNNILKVMSMVMVGVLLLFSCQHKNYQNQEESYGPGLMQVLSHYEKTNDSLKLKAAHFLIAHMHGLGTEEIELFDKDGNQMDLDIMKFQNKITPKRIIDSLNIFYNERTLKDKDHIAADLLIKHIDQAFDSWNNNLCSEILNFESFCEYLLPYRIDREPLEDWRNIAREQYHWIDDSLSKRKSLREVINFINDDLKSRFSFGQAHYKPDKSLSFSELITCKKGGCEAMTNLALFTMRALGIPVMKDFTPAWATANGRHCWNAIYLETGTLCSFQGCESNILPDRPHLFFPFDNHGKLVSGIGYRKSGKVFRYTYSIQHNALAEIAGNHEEVPPFFKLNQRFIDVTHEYMPVQNIKFTVKDNPRKKRFAYICVFNQGKWEPIYWGKITKHNNVVFKNMGRDIVYLIAYYHKGRCLPISNPFLVSLAGDVKWLTPDSTRMYDLVMKKRSNDIFSDPPQFRITPGKNYNLYGWVKNKWTLLSEKTAFSDSLIYNKIPMGGLYQLRLKGADDKERIFLSNHGDVLWM